MNLHSLKVDRDSTRNQDFHGRRIVNASPSIDNYDYVVRKELDDAIARLAKSTTNAIAGLVTTVSGAIVLYQYTLIGGTTGLTTPAVIADGTILIFVLYQDSTGGRLITWSSDFLFAPTEIGTLAYSTTIIQFVGISGKWVTMNFATGLL